MNESIPLFDSYHYQGTEDLCLLNRFVPRALLCHFLVLFDGEIAMYRALRGKNFIEEFICTKVRKVSLE